MATGDIDGIRGEAWKYLAYFLAWGVAMGFINFVEKYLWQRVAARMAGRLRTRFFDRCVRKSQSGCCGVPLQGPQRRMIGPSVTGGTRAVLTIDALLRPLQPSPTRNWLLRQAQSRTVDEPAERGRYARAQLSRAHVNHDAAIGCVN